MIPSKIMRRSRGPALCDVITHNLRDRSDRLPETTFVFENHDGGSLVPEICREVLERVDRPNIRMNFDPICGRSWPHWSHLPTTDSSPWNTKADSTAR
jgi:hypothetical protein